MLSCTILALLVQALAVAGQNAFPSNATIPNGLAMYKELQLYISDPTMDGPQYNIDFALDASSGNKSSPNVIQNVAINSTIMRVTPTNTNQLTNGSIAYISCDPDVYSQGELNVTATIQAATKEITAQNPQAGAIVLYSIYSVWCNYTETGTFNYTNVFIAPLPSSARLLEAAILSSTTPRLAQIYPPNITQNGTVIDPGDSGNDNNAPTPPSTTVAMIILYSVTGIITLCFVVVIVSGAMRARRHPERYGLLNLPGNAHQRRARGIARAMLETIPIVKFGEKEPIKIPADIEQGTEMQTTSTSLDSPQDTEKTIQSGSTTQPASGRASSSATHPNGADTHAEAGVGNTESDNGLACSVCTEDFVKGQDLRVLPCDHKFHPECIDPWLLNVSGTCPLCRIDLRPPEEREDHVPNTTEGAENFTPQEQADQPNPASSQASRFSMFLNRRRMGESTPQQRLRALRALRNHIRNEGTATNTGDAAGDGSTGAAEEHVSRSNRVSRFFGRGDDNPNTATNTSSAPPQLPRQD